MMGAELFKALNACGVMRCSGHVRNRIERGCPRLGEPGSSVIRPSILSMANGRVGVGIMEQ